MELLQNELLYCKILIQSLSKKYSPILSLYFIIIKINGTVPLYTVLFLLLLTTKL